MSWWKKKKKPRLRQCHLKISPNCQPIYKTEYKHSGHKTACPKCHKYLKKLKISVEDFMEEPKEEFEWIGKNEIRATFTNNKDLKKNGKLVRTKRETTVEITTVKDMKEGIENIKEGIERNKGQIKIFSRQIESLGKIPNRSNEIIRLEKNLIDVGKIAKAEEIKGKIDPLEEEIETNERIMNRRKEFLTTKWTPSTT